MEVPRLGAELELQLSAYITANSTQDLSHVCDPHHSSAPPWILNPLSEARDGSCILMGPSWACYQSHDGSSLGHLIFKMSFKGSIDGFGVGNE